MPRPLRVLIIDDSEGDALLIVNELKDNGFDTSWARVENAEGLRMQLAAKEWDIIVCDYIMPALSVMDVLNIVNAERSKAPVIIITGMVTDDIAPELIRAGAADFISKSDLPRLAAAVTREIDRAVRDMQAKIKDEEKKLWYGGFKKLGQIFSIKTRFVFAFGAVIAFVLAFGFYMAVKSFRDVEAMSRSWVLSIADSAAIPISALESMGPLDTPVVTEKVRQFTGEFKSHFNVSMCVLSAKGAVLAGDWQEKNGFYGADRRNSVARTLKDGIPRFFAVDYPASRKLKLAAVPVKSHDGRIVGALVADYTPAFERLISYNKSYAMMVAFMLLLIIAMLVAAGNFISASIVKPVGDIRRAMELVAGGDMEADVEIKNDDEIGQLAESFHNMRTSLKESVEQLKAEISERQLTEQTLQQVHLKLTRWVGELDKRIHEITLLNQMGKMLQSCKSVEEFYIVTLRFAEQLFPEDNGAVYIMDQTGKFMEAVSMWGKTPVEHGIAPEDCWSIRGGHIYTTESGANPNMVCRHVRARGEGPAHSTICVPMMAQGEIIGMFHLRCHELAEKQENNIKAKRSFAREQLVGAVAEHVTLALSNLKMQDTLRQQSIHDTLTGLFNRRYMKDSLEREVYRAKRHNMPFGVIMLDIDFFKKFNDTYGHDVGDVVLERMGKLIATQVRPEDIPCRYGGEEFLLILPAATAEGAGICADRILTEVRKIKIKSKGIMLGGITVSMGVATYPLNGATIDQLLKSADNALLEAKNSGRDNIILSREKAMTVII